MKEKNVDSAIEELNGLLFDDEHQIVLEDLSFDEKKEKLLEAADLLEPRDKISEATQGVIDALRKEQKETGSEEGEESLFDKVDKAKDLDELLDILEEQPVFEDMRKTLSKIKKVTELKDRMLDIIEDSEKEEEKPKGKEKPAPKEKAEKPAAKEPAKKEKTDTKERFASKKSTAADRIDFLAPLIEKGKYTKKELVEKALEKFPDVSPATFVTMLTDGKNPKYNKFPKLVVQDGDGKLCFE